MRVLAKNTIQKRYILIPYIRICKYNTIHWIDVLFKYIGSQSTSVFAAQTHPSTGNSCNRQFISGLSNGVDTVWALLLGRAVELRGWNGIALPAVHSRDAKIYIDDPGPWIMGLATEARYSVRPAPEVCVCDL